MLWCEKKFLGVVISRHLFSVFNLLALMFCGIFLIKVVMLRSLWMTAMVIKINPYPIIPCEVLIKLISSRRSLKRLGWGVLSCANIVSIATRGGIMLVLFSILNFHMFSLSLRYFLLILRVHSANGFSNSLRFKI